MGEEDLAILGQDIVLREKDELKDLLKLLPHKAQLGFSGLKQKWTNRSDKSLMKIISAAKTNESLKVEYTCIDVNSDSIAIGCNLGIIFMYNRNGKSLNKFTCENKQVPVVSIKLLKHPNFFASGQFSGTITIFQYDEDKSGQMKVPLKCTVESHHQAPITSIQWTPDGTKLFTADSSGHVAITVINMDEGKTHTVFICKEDSPVTQICFSHTALLISTLQRTLIWPFNTKKVVQVGKQSRKVFGNFGACFFPPAGIQATDEIVDVYAARPGLRLWKATMDGKVVTTMIFKDSIIKGEPLIETIDLPPHAQLPNQSEQKQFGPVIAFNDRFLVSWQGSCLWVMDPDTGYIIGCHSNLGCVVDVSVHNDEMYVLSKGDQHCIRKINFELRIPCIVVEELDLNGPMETEDEERSSVFQFEDNDKLDKLIDEVGSKMIGAIFDVKSKVMEFKPFLSGEGNSTSEEKSDDNLKHDGGTSDENIGDSMNRPFESSNELAKSYEKGPDIDSNTPVLHPDRKQQDRFDHLSLEAFPKDIVFEGTSIGKSPKRKQKSKLFKGLKKKNGGVQEKLNFTPNGDVSRIDTSLCSDLDSETKLSAKEMGGYDINGSTELSQSVSSVECYEVQMDQVNKIVEDTCHPSEQLFHSEDSIGDILRTDKQSEIDKRESNDSNGSDSIQPLTLISLNNDCLRDIDPTQKREKMETNSLTIHCSRDSDTTQKLEETETDSFTIDCLHDINITQRREETETDSSSIDRLHDSNTSQRQDEMETNSLAIDRLPNIDAMQWKDKTETNSLDIDRLPNINATQWQDETETNSLAIDRLPNINATQWQDKTEMNSESSLKSVSMETSKISQNNEISAANISYLTDGTNILVATTHSNRQDTLDDKDHVNNMNSSVTVRAKLNENTNSESKCSVITEKENDRMSRNEIMLSTTSSNNKEHLVDSVDMNHFIDSTGAYLINSDVCSCATSCNDKCFNTNNGDDIRRVNGVVSCEVATRYDTDNKCNMNSNQNTLMNSGEVLPKGEDVTTPTNHNDLLIDNISSTNSIIVKDIVSNGTTNFEPKFYFNVVEDHSVLPNEVESKNESNKILSQNNSALKDDIVSSSVVRKSIYVDSHESDSSEEADEISNMMRLSPESRNLESRQESDSCLQCDCIQNTRTDVSADFKASSELKSLSHSNIKEEQKDLNDPKLVGLNANENLNLKEINNILKTVDFPALSSPLVNVKISHQRQGSNVSIQSLSERCKEIRGEAIENSNINNRGSQLLGEDDTLEANIHHMDEENLSIASHLEDSVDDGKLYPMSPFPAPQVQSIYSQHSVNLSDFSMSHFLDTDTEANQDDEMFFGLPVDYDRIDIQNDLIESLDSITDVEDNLSTSPPENISGNEASHGATGPMKIKKKRSKGSSFRNSPCNSDMEGRPLLSPNTTTKILQERLRYLADSWAGVEMPTCAQIQFIACSDSLLWLIDNHGHIFYSSSCNQKYVWKKLDGKAMLISSNQEGTAVWCIDRQKIAYYRTGIKENNLQGSGWEPFEKNVHYIAVDKDCVWAIKANGDVFVRTGVSLQTPGGTGWITVKVASDLVQITCLNGLAWAIDIYNHVQIFQGDLNDINSSSDQLMDWCELPGITASHVTLGSKSVCWIIDSEYGVWFNQDIAKDDPLGGTWYQLSLGEGHSHDSAWFSSILNYFTEGNEPKLIIANETAGVLILGKQGSLNVAHGHLLGTRWETKVPLQLKESSWWSCVSAAGTDMNRGFTWALQPSGELFCFKPGSHSFNVRPPNQVVLKYCSAGPRSLWVLTAGLDVYIRLGISDACPQGLKWLKVDMLTQENKRLMSVSCGNHVVWAVDYYGSAWFQMGREEGIAGFAPVWISVEGCPLDGSKFTKIAVGPDDRIVWACDDKNNVYARKNITDDFWVGTTWEIVSGTSGKDVTISLNHVWALCPNGDVMCRFGVSNNNVLGDYWKKVPGSFEQISVSPNDELWGIDRQGHLYQRQTLLFYGSTLSNKAPSYNDLFSDHNDWEFI